jgi:predicted nucleic acid-binding protein
MTRKDVTNGRSNATTTELPAIEDPLTREIFDEAIGIYRNARRKSITIRSSVDCLIAACAIRRGVPVLHRDRDFDLLAKIGPLQSLRV